MKIEELQSKLDIIRKYLFYDYGQWFKRILEAKAKNDMLMYGSYHALAYNAMLDLSRFFEVNTSPMFKALNRVATSE